MSLSQWSVFLPAAVLVALSPGAGNFLALSHGSKMGFAPAVAGLLGRFTAFALMIALVIVGLGAVLEASELAFRVIKWVGVAYLCYLGLRMLNSDKLPTSSEKTAAATVSWWRLALREFGVAITNPKAILLFTAFLPQFVEATKPLPLQFTLLGAGYISIEFVAASGYAFVGSRIKSLQLGRKGQQRVNRLTGGLMLGAAAWLAIKRQ